MTRTRISVPRACSPYAVLVSPRSVGGSISAPSVVAEVEPEGSGQALAMIPDPMLAARAVGNQIALFEAMSIAIDLNGELTFKHEAVFKAGVGKRRRGAGGFRSILIDRHRDRAGAIFAQQAADHVLSGLDHALISRPDNSVLCRARIVDDEIGHRDAQGAGDNDERTDRRR